MKTLTEQEAGRLARRRNSFDKLPSATLSAEETLSSASHEMLTDTFARIFKSHHTVGGTVGLILGSRPLALLAYGRAKVSPAIPVAMDTLFRVASVSKLVFTFPVMMLVERGVLSLDEDISSYLGYAVRHPAYPDVPITIRHLLTHTASLLDGPQYDGPGINGKLGLREMLATSSGAKNFAEWQPGTMFHYSNFGAGIVGSIIEACTGMRLADAITEMLLDPLQIEGSYAPQRLTGVVNRIASGYSVRFPFPPRLAYDAPRLAQADFPPSDPERDFMASPGRLITNADGLMKLISLLYNGGSVLLNEQSIHEMVTIQDGRGSVTGECGRGLNVAVLPAGVLSHTKMYGHQGVAYGMNAEAWISPETGNGVVMLTNGTSLRAHDHFVDTGFEILAAGMGVLDQIR